MICLSSDGTNILWSTLWGQEGFSGSVHNMKINNNGDVFILSSGGNFPMNSTISGYDLTADNSGLLASSKIFPSDFEILEMDIDSNGEIHLVGEFYDSSLFTPTSNAWISSSQVQAPNTNFAFYARFSGDFTSYDYGTYLLARLGGGKVDAYFEQIDIKGNDVYIGFSQNLWNNNTLSYTSLVTPGAFTVPPTDTSIVLTITKWGLNSTTPSKVSWANTTSNNFVFDIEIDEAVRPHLMIGYYGNLGLTGVIPTTTGALVRTPDPGIGAQDLYYSIMKSDLSDYDFGTFFGSANIADIDLELDNCKAVLAGSIGESTPNVIKLPSTPSYHDFLSNTQKFIFQSSLVNNYEGFVITLHDVPVSNTINNFPTGQNTFCTNSLIHINEGPLTGNIPYLQSGNGSSASHILPDLLYNNTIVPYPQPEFSFQWQKSYNNLDWADIPGAVYDAFQPLPEPNPTTVYYRRVINKFENICPDNNISNSNVIQATITGAGSLQLNIEPVVYHCPGTPTDVNIGVSGGSGNYSWQWYNGTSPTNDITPGNGTGSAITGQIPSALMSGGSYRIIVTDLSSGCKIDGYLAVSIPVADAGASTYTMCNGQNMVQIGPSVFNADYSYSWTGPNGFTSTEPNPVVNTNGTYTLIVNGCAATADNAVITLGTSFPSTITAGPDFHVCQTDPPFTIGTHSDPGNGFVYQWVPGQNLSNTTVRNPTFQNGNLVPPNPITYTFTALRLSDGCLFTDYVTATVDTLADADILKYYHPTCDGIEYINGIPSTGNYFEWTVTSTTFPGGTTALLADPSFGLTESFGGKYLQVNFPAPNYCYDINIAFKASYLPFPNNCFTVDSAQINYCPDCGPRPCQLIQADEQGSNGVCGGSTTQLNITPVYGYTPRWTLKSVNGVMQPDQTAPLGLYYNNNGTQGSQIPISGPNLWSVIANPDSNSVYVVSLVENGTGLFDCVDDVFVFSGQLSRPVIDVSAAPICRITGGTFVSGRTLYTISNQDYNEAPNPDLIYNWTPYTGIVSGSNTPYPQLMPTSTTIYTLEVMDPLTGCSASDTLELKVNSIRANAGSDVISCPGAVTKIGTFPDPEYLYEWSPQGGLNYPLGTPNYQYGNPYLIVPTTSSTGINYTLTVSYQESTCIVSDIVNIKSTASAPLAPAAASYSICPNSSFTMGSNGLSDVTYWWTIPSGSNASLTWLDDINQSNPNVSLPAVLPPTPITFQLNLTRGSCTPTPLTTLYTLNPMSPPTLASPVTSNCGAIVQLSNISPLSGHTYRWSPKEGLYTNSTGTTAYNGTSSVPVIYAKPSSNTTYTLTVTSNLSQCFVTTTVEVIVGGTVMANAGPDQYYCGPPQSLLIGGSSSNGDTYTWTATGYNANPLGAPSASSIPPEAITYLSATNIKQPSFSQLAAAPGAYEYTLSVNSGTCTLADKVIIRVLTPASLLAGQDKVICFGDCVTLGISNLSGYTYQWFVVPSGEDYLNNQYISQPLACPQSTINYLLQATHSESGCTFEDNVSVVVNPTPLITSRDTTLCSTNYIQLTSLIENYNALPKPIWTIYSYPGSSITNTVVSPPNTTSYYLHSVNEYGCFDTAEVIVNVENLQPPFTVGYINICNGTTTSLLLFNPSLTSPDNHFEWHTTNQLSSSLVPNPETVGAGTYYIFEVSPSGCYSLPSSLTINAVVCGSCPLVENLVTAEDTICNEQSFDLFVSSTGLDSVIFIYSSNSLTDPYMGGSVLGSAPIINGYAQLIDNALPINLTSSYQTYFIYAILKPTPSDASCRPFGQLEIVVSSDLIPITNDTAICQGSNTYITINISGGTTPYSYSWTGPLGFSSSVHSPLLVNPSTSMSGNYIVSVTDALNCSVIDTLNVQVIGSPNAGSDGSTSVCDNNTPIINLFDLISGEQTGGTWSRLTGTGGTFNAAACTFIPAQNDTSSTFIYVLTGLSPCSNDTSIATVNISAHVNSGSDGSTSVCDNNTPIINLFDLISGEQTGGTWSRLTGTGGTFNAAAGTFIPAQGATSSTFMYVLTGLSPCPNDTSIASVTIQNFESAGTDGSIDTCAGNNNILSLSELINNESPNGNWYRLSGTGGIFDETNGTFQLTSNADQSVFIYVVLNTGQCTSDTSYVNISISGSCCTMSASHNTSCNSNNNANTPTDDWYTLIVNGSMTGGSGAYTVKIGTYTSSPAAIGAVLTVIGNGLNGNPLLKSDGLSIYSVRVEDSNDTNCFFEFTTSPVNPCSNCPSGNCFDVKVKKN